MADRQHPVDLPSNLVGPPSVNHPDHPHGGVVVVDDDPHIRLALSELLEQHGYQVTCHAYGESLLGRGVPPDTHCLILDLSFPGAFDGIKLLGLLRARRVTAPAIFLSGAGDVRSAVRAMHAGAADFIEKPFKPEDLLTAISQCVAISRGGRGTDAMRARFASLSPREQAVLRGVIHGLTSKEIAGRLGISPRTVELYRLNTMEKLNVRNVAEMVRISFMLQPQLLQVTEFDSELNVV